jgi:hypothetical protein
VDRLTLDATISQNVALLPNGSGAGEQPWRAATRLCPGNVVVQRGTNHAWIAHGGTALFLAVLIDRELTHA